MNVMNMLRFCERYFIKYFFQCDSKDEWSVQRFGTHFLQKIFLQIIQLLRKIHVNLLRICKTSGFIPERVLLFLAVGAKFHNRRRSIHTFSFFDYRNKKLAKLVGSSEDLRLFPGINRFKDDHGFFRIKVFVFEADKVSLYFSGGFCVFSL